MKNTLENKNYYYYFIETIFFQMEHWEGEQFGKGYCCWQHMKVYMGELENKIRLSNLAMAGWSIGYIPSPRYQFTVKTQLEVGIQSPQILQGNATHQLLQRNQIKLAQIFEQNQRLAKLRTRPTLKPVPQIRILKRNC
jgi:hypothetical protein